MKLRFTIRDLLLLTFLVALVAGANPKALVLLTAGCVVLLVVALVGAVLYWVPFFAIYGFMWLIDRLMD